MTQCWASSDVAKSKKKNYLESRLMVARLERRKVLSFVANTGSSSRVESCSRISLTASF